MDVNDLKSLNAEVRKRMDAAIEHLRHELAGVRTGRASTGILDPVHVDAYGTRMPLNQVASLSVPEPTMIVAQPFDPSLMGAIEKAIRASDLGLNPNNDGKVVRIPVPALTDERRKELSRHVHKMAEEGAQRRALGPPRRQRAAEEAAKDKKVSEDDEKRGPRRGAEDHRPAHQADRRAAEEEGRGAAHAGRDVRIRHPMSAARPNPIPSRAVQSPNETPSARALASGRCRAARSSSSPPRPRTAPARCPAGGRHHHAELAVD